MSTRGSISVVLADGSIRSVYCHFDSYLMGVGRTLLLHYNSQELAEQITSFGAISILDQRINPIGDHTFRADEDGTCVFYARDRCDPMLTKYYISKSDFNLSNSHQDYNYVFFDNSWHVSRGDTGFNEMNRIKMNDHSTKVMVE